MWDPRDSVSWHSWETAATAMEQLSVNENVSDIVEYWAGKIMFSDHVGTF